jgi:hypothetical protein
MGIAIIIKYKRFIVMILAESIELVLVQNSGGIDQMKTICEEFFGNVWWHLVDCSAITMFNPSKSLINENLQEKMQDI